MSHFIFSGLATFHLKNGRILRLLDQQLDFMVYELVGFGGGVMLLDYREVGLQAAAKFARKPLTDTFATQMSAPALVDIWEVGPDQLWVELYDPPSVPDTPHISFTLSLAPPANHRRTSIPRDLYYRTVALNGRQEAVLALGHLVMPPQLATVYAGPHLAPRAN